MHQNINQQKKNVDDEKQSGTGWRGGVGQGVGGQFKGRRQQDKRKEENIYVEEEGNKQTGSEGWMNGLIDGQMNGIKIRCRNCQGE